MPATAAASAVPSAGSSRSVASVAALYRATDPGTRGTSVAAAVPDHPPLPLMRPGAATAGAAAPMTAAAGDPAHQLSAENAMLQRQMSAGRSPAAPGAPQLVNTPVPLQLTGQSLPATHPRVLAATAAPAPSVTRPATGSTTTAGSPTAPAPASDGTKAPAAPTDLAVGTPAEISQKMMAALDKYMRLQQQQDVAAASAAGGKVDVSP
jgi:hypothetical protein